MRFADAGAVARMNFTLDTTRVVAWTREQAKFHVKGLSEEKGLSYDERKGPSVPIHPNNCMT